MHTPYPIMRHLLCLLPLIVTLCAVRLFIGADEAVFLHFNEVRAANPDNTFWVRLFSDSFIFLLYPVYLFLLYRGLKYARPAEARLAIACFIAQILVCAVLCRFAKVAIGRPRPMTGGSFMFFSLDWGYQAFPSGHTAESLGASLPLIFNYGRVFLPLCLGFFVAAIGYSRLYLGMHHPTDIWGGIVFGSLSGYVCWKIFRLPAATVRRFLPGRIAEWPRTKHILETVFR